MRTQPCGSPRPFFGLVLFCATAGCGSVKGELHVGDYWDLVANKCTNVVGLHETLRGCDFVVTGADALGVADGTRICVGVSYDDFKEGWVVSLQNLSGAARSPIVVEARDCSTFNVYSTSDWGHSGYVQLDCSIENGRVHVTGNLTFSFCGVLHRVE